MKFSAAALVLAATGAMANKNVTYVTEVVSAYTTYCPGPTVISHADKTYTITKVRRIREVDGRISECLGARRPSAGFYAHIDSEMARPFTSKNMSISTPS